MTAGFRLLGWLVWCLLSHLDVWRLVGTMEFRLPSQSGFSAETSPAARFPTALLVLPKKKNTRFSITR